jgi:ribonucleotide reductase alpha subunit
MLDKFDWDALMAELKKHPIRSKILIATPPRDAPHFITNGCTDGIEPIRPWKTYERIAEIRLPSDGRVPQLATKINIGD